MFIITFYILFTLQYDKYIIKNIYNLNETDNCGEIKPINKYTSINNSVICNKIIKENKKTILEDNNTLKRFKKNNINDILIEEENNKTFKSRNKKLEQKKRDKIYNNLNKSKKEKYWTVGPWKVLSEGNLTAKDCCKLEKPPYVISKIPKNFIRKLFSQNNIEKTSNLIEEATRMNLEFDNSTFNPINDGINIKNIKCNNCFRPSEDKKTIEEIINLLTIKSQNKNKLKRTAKFLINRLCVCNDFIKD